jgi:TfoX/Sxy family transcriptional regulator of competence genes
MNKMTKSASQIPSEKIALYDKLIATNPAIVRKGASIPYTSLNGHMFSFITKEGKLALRLPAEEREYFMEKYDTTLCEQYGRVMKEYVVVPDQLLKNTNDLKKYFDQSYSYVGNLKPKSTKKRTRKKNK